MATKKWHVFYHFESSITSISPLYVGGSRDSLYHAEFDTEEAARAFVKNPGSASVLNTFRLKFVIHGDRIDPTVRTVEKVHTTFDQEVVWE